MPKIISFDMDGTLVDSEFTDWVWLHGIPKLYAEKTGLPFERAKHLVVEEYLKVGEGAIEWYDIKYWFQFFKLEQSWKVLMERYVDKISIYPNVNHLLERLKDRFQLVLTSNAGREFIDVEMEATLHRPELWAFFTALPTPIVVDHMGRPDVTKPVDGPEFALFLRFLREHPNAWSKVSCPERLSVSGPDALDGEPAAYRDVVPFARRVVDEFPDRVLWGTDWPHPNLKGHMPDDGLLVDFIPHIATTAERQRQLLVDNPMRLYWPEEVQIG